MDKTCRYKSNKPDQTGKVKHQKHNIPKYKKICNRISHRITMSEKTKWAKAKRNKIRREKSHANLTTKSTANFLRLLQNGMHQFCTFNSVLSSSQWPWIQVGATGPSIIQNKYSSIQVITAKLWNIIYHQIGGKNKAVTVSFVQGGNI